MDRQHVQIAVMVAVIVALELWLLLAKPPGPSNHPGRTPYCAMRDCEKRITWR